MTVTQQYKSKDIEYMKMLKKAVLTGMRGSHPDAKQKTWEHVRKQVTLDDLHAYAVQNLGKLVHFPTENVGGNVMVVFRNPPEEHEKDIVHKMMDALKVKREDVYITWLDKIYGYNQEEEATLVTVLNSEISIVDPSLVLSFGLNFGHEPHTVTDFKNGKIMATYNMDWLFKDSESSTLQERKTALWKDVVELMKHYNSN